MVWVTTGGGTLGGGAIVMTCPGAGVRAAKTVVIANIAAVAIRRILNPIPAGTAGIAILHGAWSTAMPYSFNRT